MSLRLTSKERDAARAYRAMMRKARLRNRVGSKPSFHGRMVDPSHKQAISKLFCIATAIRTGFEVRGVHVSHLRYSNARAGAFNPGLQRKPDDRWALPLSPHEHRVQHSMGERAYWEALGIDPHELAAALWDVSPDAYAMGKVLRQAVEDLSTPHRLFRRGQDGGIEKAETVE